MNEEFFLYEACLEAEKIYWQPIIDEIKSAPEVLITNEADKRTHKLLCKLEKKLLNQADKSAGTKKGKQGLKVLLVAAILIILLSVSAFSFNPFKSFVYNVFSRGTEFIFNYNKREEDDFLNGIYEYIPKGYKLIEDEKYKQSKRIIYKSGSNRIIMISNAVKHSSLHIDTEKAETGNIKVNQYDGYYSITDSNIILLWSTGKYYHYIVADFNEDIITLDSVLKIAESRKQEK